MQDYRVQLGHRRIKKEDPASNTALGILLFVRDNSS